MGGDHGATEPQEAGAGCRTTDEKRWEMSKTVYVNHPVAKVWALMEDFVAIYRWHPAVVSSVLAAGEPQQPGVVRYVVSASGDTFYERLDELDSAGHRVAYTALDNTFGLVDYHAQISLRPGAQPDSGTAAATVMTWSSNMSPSPVKSRDQIYAILGESFVRCGQYITQVLSAGSESSEAVALPAGSSDTAVAAAASAPSQSEDVVSSSSSLEAAAAAAGGPAAPLTAPPNASTTDSSQAPTTVST